MPSSVLARKILRLFGYGRRRRLMQIDNHWRRKLILATRKLQHVEVLMRRDLEDMRGRDGSPAAPAPAASSPGESQELARMRESVELILTNMSRQGELITALSEKSSEIDQGRMFEELQALQNEESQLRTRVKEMEEARAYLEAQHCHKLADVRSEHRKEVSDLQKKLKELYATGALVDRRKTPRDGDEDPRVAQLQALLKERERSIAEMEGKHTEAMAQFADQSAQRVKQVQAQTHKERQRAEEYAARCKELELQIDELKHATWEIFQLQGESLPEDLQSGFSRIVELMQVVDDAGQAEEEDEPPSALGSDLPNLLGQDG